MLLVVQFDFDTPVLAAHEAMLRARLSVLEGRERGSGAADSCTWRRRTSQKDGRNSPRKIDLIVAAVIAFERRSSTPGRTSSSR
jgi:hypothetical protein